MGFDGRRAGPQGEEVKQDAPTPRGGRAGFLRESSPRGQGLRVTRRRGHRQRQGGLRDPRAEIPAEAMEVSRGPWEANKSPLLSRYFENIPKGLDREGWTRGSIQPQKMGGYALNQPVTRMEATPNPTESLRRLHPHVGRTLTSVDPFYRDTPHSSRYPASS
ncbi:Hypothetical predicted protein [Marmota monax]|uniref:Uncharacterized protein n=1 Tax=Marmota monax TaxID=9995 RepID=A0A5E4AJ21_MARMO|nr:Hypothetical predicted protein [Marmota monax]